MFSFYSNFADAGAPVAQSLYGRYKLHHLAQHRAAVLFPYSVQSQSAVELYALGVPLFLPTIDFLLQLQVLDDRRQVSHWLHQPCQAKVFTDYLIEIEGDIMLCFTVDKAAVGATFLISNIMYHVSYSHDVLDSVHSFVSRDYS